MAKIRISTDDIKIKAPTLNAGDEVLLSGYIYTARDAAHKRIAELIKNGEKLPFVLDGATIYYSGPTPAKGDMPIGACGPTTSSRMDSYTPMLLDRGLTCMIGKGNRSEEVIKSIQKSGAVYLCAIGGAGALAAKCVKKLEVIAFEELGCESVKRLYVEDFPLICAIDSKGSNLYEKAVI